MKGFYESAFKEKLDTITEFWLVNLLWVIVCLPMITIPPATFALYHVLYKWVKGEGGGLWKEFFHGFKEYFFRSYLIFFGWGLIAVSTYYYYSIVTGEGNSGFATFGMAITILLLIISFMVYVYIIPFHVMLQASTKRIVALSMMFAVRHIGLTLLLFTLLLVTALFVFLLPYLGILAFIPTIIYFQIWLIYRRVLADKERFI
ncbi:YesL family protein [Anaerobacillus sp. CMMVII]|uniref:YesL family protein n=1 Tax=Anaerobacillus sp. CMMVII TaxID=2755588 RepID=UPI0021B7D21E|nr:YesL family protein [Anaerobacillus sp. CMMVII]MCT8137584.1 YesL family protein [Anaerobacillus sp. CMMVII]